MRPVPLEQQDLELIKIWLYLSTRSPSFRLRLPSSGLGCSCDPLRARRWPQLRSPSHQMIVAFRRWSRCCGTLTTRSSVLLRSLRRRPGASWSRRRRVCPLRRLLRSVASWSRRRRVGLRPVLSCVRLARRLRRIFSARGPTHPGRSHITHTIHILCTVRWSCRMHVRWRHVGIVCTYTCRNLRYVCMQQSIHTHVLPSSVATVACVAMSCSTALGGCPSQRCLSVTSKSVLHRSLDVALDSWMQFNRTWMPVPNTIPLPQKSYV